MALNKANVLQRRIVTEKSTREEALSTYVFKVMLTATSQDVKEAIVYVWQRSRRVNLKLKVRQSLAAIASRWPSWIEKAYVTLQAGETIEFESWRVRWLCQCY